MNKSGIDKILIEEGKKSYIKKLISTLEKIKEIPFDKKSIHYDQILGVYKGIYETQFKKINELGIAIPGIIKRYSEIIDTYNLPK